MMRKLKEEIENLLSPLVGQTMARSILKVSCQQLHLDLDKELLSMFDLPKVAAKVELSLSVFVGRERAHEFSAKIENLARTP
jgi:hypothetical protein